MLVCLGLRPLREGYMGFCLSEWHCSAVQLRARSKQRTMGDMRGILLVVLLSACDSAEVGIDAEVQIMPDAQQIDSSPPDVLPDSPTLGLIRCSCGEIDCVPLNYCVDYQYRNNNCAALCQGGSSTSNSCEAASPDCY